MLKRKHSTTTNTNTIERRKPGNSSISGVNSMVFSLHQGNVNLSYHIEAETKWTPFRRRHFEMHSLNENAWSSLEISLKFVPKVWINTIPSLA